MTSGNTLLEASADTENLSPTQDAIEAPETQQGVLLGAEEPTPTVPATLGIAFVRRRSQGDDVKLGPPQLPIEEQAGVYLGRDVLESFSERLIRARCLLSGIQNQRMGGDRGNVL